MARIECSAASRIRSRSARNAAHATSAKGCQGASYFAPIATGKNTYYTHYNRNTAVLGDGDLAQFDYAPDYKYYQSDVTRVFPANGVFTPRQREMYEIYLELYRALMTSSRLMRRLRMCLRRRW